MDIQDKTVILVGEGDTAREKLDILLSFGVKVKWFTAQCQEYKNDIFPANKSLEENDLKPRPTFVVVAEVPEQEKKRISTLCRKNNIPVNVVDEPALCSFYFPSLITRGPLTISVSTGGKSPGGAAWIRRNLEQHIPDQTEEILEWAHTLRQRLREEESEINRKAVLRKAIASAFEKGSPLSQDEISVLIDDNR